MGTDRRRRRQWWRRRPPSRVVGGPSPPRVWPTRAALAPSRHPAIADDAAATYALDTHTNDIIFLFFLLFPTPRPGRRRLFRSRRTRPPSPPPAAAAAPSAPRERASPIQYTNGFICFTVSRSYAVLSADDFSYDIITRARPARTRRPPVEPSPRTAAAAAAVVVFDDLVRSRRSPRSALI